MSEAYLGEIRMAGFNFAPAGWSMLNGQLLSSAQNNALYALIGTTYGGDGQTTFALPNLQSRVPMGQGQGTGLSSRIIGQMAGSESVTLTTSQLPTHAHQLVANNVKGQDDVPNANSMPSQAVQAGGGQSALLYTTGGAVPVQPKTMLPQAIGVSGNGLPHDNRAPALTITFIIALQGIFPTRN